MKIGNKDVLEIIVVDDERNLVASITDDNIISDKSYEVLVNQADLVEEREEE